MKVCWIQCWVLGFAADYAFAPKNHEFLNMSFPIVSGFTLFNRAVLCARRLENTLRWRWGSSTSSCEANSKPLHPEKWLLWKKPTFGPFARAWSQRKQRTTSSRLDVSFQVAFQKSKSHGRRGKWIVHFFFHWLDFWTTVDGLRVSRLFDRRFLHYSRVWTQSIPSIQSTFHLFYYVLASMF